MRPIQKVAVPIGNSMAIMTHYGPSDRQTGRRRHFQADGPRNRRHRSPSRLTEIYNAMTRVLPPLLPAGMTVSRMESAG